MSNPNNSTNDELLWDVEEPLPWEKNYPANKIDPIESTETSINASETIDEVLPWDKNIKPKLEEKVPWENNDFETSVEILPWEKNYTENRSANLPFPDPVEIQENDFSNEEFTSDQDNSDQSFEDNIEIILSFQKDMYLLRNSELRVANQISYETFLLFKFIGQVSYASRGQFERFYQAYKQNFEPGLGAFKSAFSSLLHRKLIDRLEKPVRFSKGRLKNGKLNIYYITVKGKGILQKFGRQVNNFDEPKGNTFNRLSHELLITEVAIDLIEKGNFLYSIKNEAELRKDQIRQKERNFKDFITVQDNAISDFGVHYFDCRAGRKVNIEGEIAVKYNSQQIWAKPDYLFWFCYDRTEAEKIWYHKNEIATILDNKLIVEAGIKLEGDERKVPPNTYPKLNKWLQLFGGLTGDLAKLLTRMRIGDIYKQLRNMAGVVKIETSVSPGTSIGRTRTCYIFQKYYDDFLASRNIFFTNMAFEYFLNNQFICKFIDSKPYLEATNGEKLFIISDASKEVDEVEFEDRVVKIRELEMQMNAHKIRFCFIVEGSKMTEYYKKMFPNSLQYSIEKLKLKYETRRPKGQKNILF